MMDVSCDVDGRQRHCVLFRPTVYLYVVDLGFQFHHEQICNDSHNRTHEHSAALCILHEFLDLLLESTRNFFSVHVDVVHHEHAYAFVESWLQRKRRNGCGCSPPT